MNLLKETISVFNSYNLVPHNILFIGCEETAHRCSWEQFQTLADREYDGGYGCAEVLTDLVIVFVDGTKLSRSEYDGSEWWSVLSQQKPLRHLLLQTQLEIADENYAFFGDEY
jgi:hypothetical protein